MHLETDRAMDLPTSMAERLAWRSSLKASSELLLRSLRQRWVRPVTGGLRLCARPTIGEAPADIRYRGLELAWFIPGRLFSIAAQIDIYLSRFHFSRGADAGRTNFGLAAGIHAAETSSSGLKMRQTPDQFLLPSEASTIRVARRPLENIGRVGTMPSANAIGAGFDTQVRLPRNVARAGGLRFAARAYKDADESLVAGDHRPTSSRSAPRSIQRAPLVAWSPGSARKSAWPIIGPRVYVLVHRPKGQGLQLPSGDSLDTLPLAWQNPGTTIQPRQVSSSAAAVTTILQPPDSNRLTGSGTRTLLGDSKTSTLVDALYEQGCMQGTVPGLSLRMLPPTTVADLPVPNIRADGAPVAPSSQAQWVNPPSASLTRSEVTQIAERVAQVLRDRQRFEREREGRR